MCLLANQNERGIFVLPSVLCHTVCVSLGMYVLKTVQKKQNNNNKKGRQGQEGPRQQIYSELLWSPAEARVAGTTGAHPCAQLFWYALMKEAVLSEDPSQACMRIG